MDRLSADPNLLSIIGSYGDTLSDQEILALPRAYNATVMGIASAMPELAADSLRRRRFPR